MVERVRMGLLVAILLALAGGAGTTVYMVFGLLFGQYWLGIAAGIVFAMAVLVTPLLDATEIS